MKTLILTVIASMFTISLYAQNQYATTTDGKKVILKSDGTWEYVKGNPSPAKSLHSGGNKSTSSNTRTSSSSVKKPTGRTYIRGPRGGCYYINSNGNKTYVDRSFCN